MGEADPKDQDNNNVNNQGSNHEMTGGLTDGSGTTDVTDLGGSFWDSFKFNPENVLVGAAIAPIMGAGVALMASKFAKSQGLDVRGETPDDPDGGKFASGSVGNETKPVDTREVGEEFYGVGNDPMLANSLFTSGAAITPEDERKNYNLALRAATNFKGKFGDENFQSFVDADETGNLKTISDNMAGEFNKGVFKGKMEFVDIPMDPGLINNQSGGRLDSNTFAIKHVDATGNVKFYAPNMSALSDAYRDENPDVANQGGNYTNASDFRRHYEEFGKNEGRNFWKTEIFDFSNVGTPTQRLGQGDTTENPMNPFLNDVTDVFKSYTEGVYEDPRNAGGPFKEGGIMLKGMMSPMHFFTGGGAGDDNPAADPNADNTDADTGSTDKDKDKDKNEAEARDRDLATFESGLVDESRNESGGQTQGGPGFSGVHGMSDPSEAGPGGAGNLVDSLVESIAHNIIGKYVNTLVGAHDFGNKAQEKAREQGIAFDTGVNEGDHAQGFSGRGKGVDIGEPSGVSGAGDNPDDSIILKVEAPETTVSAQPKVWVPGLGLFSRGGIMGYHKGGDVVDDLGVIHDPSTHTHEDENTSPGVDYAPIDYEDFMAKTFGWRHTDPKYGGKSQEELIKSYQASPLVDKKEATRRQELANTLNLGRRSVENWNEEGGNEVFKANRAVASTLRRKFGLDQGEIASVIHNFRGGNSNIFEGTSKFNQALENERALSYLTALAEGLDARREGITDKDIGEGQTNRDILKKIFSPQFKVGENSQGQGGAKIDNTAYNMLLNKGDKENAFIKDKYNVDLDAAATVDEVNKFMPVIWSGGLNAENTFAGETYEDVVARGDKTPAEHRQGLMSKKTAEEDSRFVEGLGQV